MKMRILLVAMVMFLFVTIAQAGPPILVDPQTGKYLGNLSSNQFDPNSVNNPFGRYGSEFSPDSINNQFGEYGSQFSPNSINNQFATGAPVIVHRHNYGVVNRHSDATGYNPIGELSNNLAEQNRVLNERNRIIERESYNARQERERVRLEAWYAEYIRNVYYNRPSTPPDYNQYTPPPMTKSDWERLKKQFPAVTSNTDVTKPVSSGKPMALVNFFDPSASPSADVIEPPPDLSKAPKWADIVVMPAYSKLAPETQITLKGIYFNYWIAPHVNQQQAAALRQQFMSMKP